MVSNTGKFSIAYFKSTTYHKTDTIIQVGCEPRLYITVVDFQQILIKITKLNMRKLLLFMY